jgi:hypothetical protein
MNTEPIVMAGLDPAIHGRAPARIRAEASMDHRVKRGDDD